MTESVRSLNVVHQKENHFALKEKSDTENWLVGVKDIPVVPELQLAPLIQNSKENAEHLVPLINV